MTEGSEFGIGTRRRPKRTGLWRGKHAEVGMKGKERMGHGAEGIASRG